MQYQRLNGEIVTFETEISSDEPSIFQHFTGIHCVITALTRKDNILFVLYRNIEGDEDNQERESWWPLALPADEFFAPIDRKVYPIKNSHYKCIQQPHKFELLI